MLWISLRGINWFKKITDLNPNSPTGLYHVALSYEIMGKLDSAILTAQALVDNAPVNSGGYELLSKFYRKKGMVNQAIVLLKGGIEKEPGISLYHLLAETYWQNGEPTEALAWYKKVTEIGTQNPYEQWMLCLANYRLGNTEALAPCGLEEEKVDEYLLYNNAVLYALVGEEEESLKWLKKAFDKFYFDYQSVLIDIDLRNIQDEPEFKALLRKYFPHQFKG